MEKRKASRVNFVTETFCTCDGNIYSATVKNLSLKGALLEFDTSILDCDSNELNLEMKFSGESSSLQINVTAKIVRRGANDLGVEFEAMDLDSFMHLRNIVAYNNGDYDHIMDEFLVGV